LKDYINFIIGALLLVSFIGLVEINDNYVTGYGVAPVRQQSSQQGHVDVNKRNISIKVEPKSPTKIYGKVEKEPVKVNVQPQNPTKIYGKAEKKTYKTVGANQPEATVDTSAGTTVVTTSQPKFRTANKPKKEEKRENRSEIRRRCINKCDSKFYRCADSCSENPFTKALCVTECAGKGKRCKDKC